MKVMKLLKTCLLFFILSSFTGNITLSTKERYLAGENISLIILGTLQDAGSPQVGCNKDCCNKLFLNPDKNRLVVSLGLIDAINQKKYLFEATPDFSRQAKALKNQAAFSNTETPDGIFLTHAHIGHYTGLMYLGKEAMNAAGVAVYAMPRMRSFLQQHGPWSQLVNNRNINLMDMVDQREIHLSSRLTVIPFTIPHRDEFSETVGYKIIGPNKTALFIPDIDKWEKWNTNITDAIAAVDYAFVDGTFYDAAEISNPKDPVARDISTIPHPFIMESMNRFKDLSATEKKKIHFIHFNHTNPVINKSSQQYRQVIQNGFNVAEINMQFDL